MLNCSCRAGICDWSVLPVLAPSSHDHILPLSLCLTVRCVCEGVSLCVLNSRETTIGVVDW